MFRGIPLLFCKLFSSHFSSIGRQIPFAKKQSRGRHWRRRVSFYKQLRLLSKENFRTIFVGHRIQYVAIEPSCLSQPVKNKQEKILWFELDLLQHSERHHGSLFGLLGRRSFTSFHRQKSELWLASPVRRCQEIPRWIPLSHSRNYTMISPRTTGQVKLSKAFCLQLDHLWCMFLPPCLFKLTLAAYYTTAHSL